MYGTVKKENMDIRLKGYLLWGLIAVELLMSFSFLGYIHIEPISLTLVYIPVLLAGCLMGVWEATIVGIVFGLASMWKASAFYVSAGDELFSPTMSGKPLQSILLSVGARALFGLIIGILYLAAKHSKYRVAGILMITSMGRLIHSACVYGFMGIFFPEFGSNIFSAFHNILEKENIIFLVIQDVVVLSCYFIQNSGVMKRFGAHIKTMEQMRVSFTQNRKMMAIAVILIFAASFSVAWYFIDRIESVMSWHGIHISGAISHDIIHLQIQFLFGIISLFAIVILVIVLYLKNFNYLYYEAKLDGLTGLISREQFFLQANKILENRKAEQEGKQGYFLIFDIDRFKEINDRHGHPMGDKVLKNVAGNLKEVLSDNGILGRLGGDEFVVFVYRDMEESEIRAYLSRIKENIAQIDIGGEKVTCSVGVMPVKKGYTIEKLYHSADRLLYEAKKKGRDQFVIERSTG